mmetsp:Transcript_43191/g.91802  ORF Transcript_43191/g.91802 Transcript_43191/m.91802 type:complete len:473 (-) Transcript_43191:216-1634(-)
MVFRTASVVAGLASGAHWALIAAGSKGYENYRHQADVCHAYQLLRSKGFAEERIIVMAYDDVAHDKENPFPGKLFNVPDPNGTGVDVRAGCKIDYSGSAVNSSNFLAVLQGLPSQGGNGRVLKTSKDDEVFVNFVDHGAKGVIGFPDGDVLHREDLLKALHSMHDKGRYKHLLFYLEACNSGSMFVNMTSNISVYAVTAVDPDHPSLGTYCGDEATVNGTQLATCLGDLFSVYWMDQVAKSNKTLSLSTLYQTVSSSVASYASLHWGNEENQQYGDLSMVNMSIADFLYAADHVDAAAQPGLVPPKEVFSARRIDMQRLTHMYTDLSAKPTSPHRHMEWPRLQFYSKAMRALARREDLVQAAFRNLIAYAYPMDEEKRVAVWTANSDANNRDCEVGVHDAMRKSCTAFDINSGFALQFHQVVVNLCADTVLGWGSRPQSAIDAGSRACGGRDYPPNCDDEEDDVGGRSVTLV